MKPYYEHAGITIYHGDCRAWVDSAPECFRVDVVVTDPPYGVEFGGKNTKHTTRRNNGYLGGDDGDVGPAVVGRLILAATRAAVFPGCRGMFKYPEPEDIGCVYCPSGAGIGRWGFTCIHPILFYGKRPSNALFPCSMMSFATSEANGHPCPKPEEWMRWLIKLTSLDTDTILDPFMGSGTTLRAAKDLGRRAIGIEIEEKYCEIAAKRLSQEVLDFQGVQG
jgi:DNA modification methylase